MFVPAALHWHHVQGGPLGGWTDGNMNDLLAICFVGDGDDGIFLLSVVNVCWNLDRHC